MAEWCMSSPPDWGFGCNLVIGSAGVLNVPEFDHFVQTACYDMVLVLPTPIDSIDLLLVRLNTDERRGSFPCIPDFNFGIVCRRERVFVFPIELYHRGSS